MGKVVKHVFAGRDVDAHVAPFLGWDLRQSTLHQCFAGRNDLDDRGVSFVKIALDRADQGRRLHRCE